MKFATYAWKNSETISGKCHFTAPEYEQRLTISHSRVSDRSASLVIFTICTLPR
jgi:hypothetical protein